MTNRTRPIRIEFRVSDYEHRLIKNKMAQLGTRNMGAYLRKMAIDGYIINVDGLGVLQGSIAELEKKTRFIESSYQGRNESLREASSLDDLLTLRNNNVYIKSINAVEDTIVLNIALFAMNKRAEKICDAVCKAESTIASTFGNIKLTYRIHIYSLANKSEATEKRVKNRLLSVQGNATKADFYDSILFFHWYDKKNTLFSGIEIERWL